MKWSSALVTKFGESDISEFRVTIFWGFFYEGLTPHLILGYWLFYG